MVQVTLFQRTYVNIVAEHTGQSSQLFPVTLGRNAQFLATVAGNGLADKSKNRQAAAREEPFPQREVRQRERACARCHGRCLPRTLFEIRQLRS